MRPLSTLSATLLALAGGGIALPNPKPAASSHPLIEREASPSTHPLNRDASPSIHPLLNRDASPSTHPLLQRDPSPSSHPLIERDPSSSSHPLLNRSPSDPLPNRATFTKTTYPPPTWDKSSLFLLGRRVMLFGGEFHPFRLPVPSLWRDVLEKMKAAGLNTVSIVIPWALLEGKPGEVRAEGIFALEPFFEAARDVGLWVVVKPGPYVGGQVTGGGLPGWIQRLKGHPRTADADFLASTNNYAANVAAIIAKAQINNGGKVIFYQPESEYSVSRTLIGFNFPDPGYMQYVEDQARRAGIVVPFINNDAFVGGHNAPGTGVGQVDVYARDLYPLDPECNDPQWQKGEIRDAEFARHINVSGSTPYAIAEFQGGSPGLWGGAGLARCGEQFGAEHSRVSYKSNYASGVKIFSVYMAYGGTNWGNLGYDSGFTSYDYAAAIAEDRSVAREKYSELKLQGNFFRVSPGYLEANPDPSKPTTGLYSSNKDITITPVLGPKGSFFVTRKTAYRDAKAVQYTLNLPTSKGTLAIPKLGGSLTMPGRDTRIHVTDYPLGESTLVYCTAEIFTWQKYASGTVVVVYGNAGETHELLLKRGAKGPANITTSKDVKTKTEGDLLYAQWKVDAIQEDQFILAGDIRILLVSRQEAYDFWTVDLDGQAPLIIDGGYLMRSASYSASDGILSLRGDLNRSTITDVMRSVQATTISIYGAPAGGKALMFNNRIIEHNPNPEAGSWTMYPEFTPPKPSLPSLASLPWKPIDSLPELAPSYSDAPWPAADHKSTNNTYLQSPLTPTSLFASDYSFHAGGAILYRGHFTAKGGETSLMLRTQGGAAFAALYFLDATFLGSWAGNASRPSTRADTFPVRLTPGREYVLTVVIDNMGNAQNALVGGDEMKAPRGVMEYGFEMGGGPGDQPEVRWKVTGNLGGEGYVDKFRGPLNEGGLWVERNGYHQPSVPADKLDAAGRMAASGAKVGKSPLEGINQPGIGFWTAEMVLNMPNDGWDVPLSFEFPAIDAAGAGKYRAVLWVNGFQFGRYISHIGPQTSFPVPEGILNYRGSNTIAVAIWATQPGGARLASLDLKAGTAVQTGRMPVKVVAAPAWAVRAGAY